MSDVPVQYHKHPTFFTVDDLIEAKKDRDIRKARSGTEREMPEDQKVIDLIDRALSYNQRQATELFWVKKAHDDVSSACAGCSKLACYHCELTPDSQGWLFCKNCAPSLWRKRTLQRGLDNASDSSTKG